MEAYSALRSFADSWAMVSMLAIFIGIVAWVFRPGSRPEYDDTARSIFRNEDKPKDDANGG